MTTKQIVFANLLRSNPMISRKEIAKRMDINESAVQKRIEALKKKGVLRRVGSDKGGRWEVIEDKAHDRNNLMRR